MESLAVKQNKSKICQKCFEAKAVHDNLCEECYLEEINDSALDFDLWDKYVIGNDSNYRGYMHQNLED